ncbi:thioesterase family protein [Blastococcus sp. Marseille-P5729]|uniref:thioesterase family protein n=1 Tax=Blastococcus sp. Marseille-P5729 TaxID=2086582 RepID=UPI000D0F3420|nr:thioesterase family protein [Blastococcus sp. Marseille-P5729]
MPQAYFTSVGAGRYRASEHTSGAWDPREQHISPALGLMIHEVERDRDRRRDDQLMISRLSYDILGTVPVGEVTIEVRVIRAGRTIELVEAVLSHEGRSAVLLRAWLLQRQDTARVEGTPLPRIPDRHQLQPWSPTEVWPGGFIASADAHRQQHEPGQAAFWVRPRVELIEGEQVSGIARAAGLIDIANGMTVRQSPQDVAFPNVDLTAHFFAEPRGDWLGFDTAVSFGADGVGLTHSILHDETGPIGSMSQILTVRPKG